MFDKAVAVAKDVLARLEHLRLCQGNYLDLMRGFPTEEIDWEGDLQDHVDIVEANCDVCQLGACLLSKARLYDDIPMEVFLDLESTCSDRGIRAALADVFDPETLDLMEAAFEQDMYEWMESATRERIGDALHFGANTSYDDYDVVKATMENIIANNGVFNPPVWEETRPRNPVEET